MFNWLDIVLAVTAAIFFAGSVTPRLRTYRSLFLGSGTLLGITLLFPWPGNPVGQKLFAQTTGAMHLPLALFGIAWWILGAWLIRSLLTLILRRTLFPNDFQPHARRLFADLGSAMVYLVAFVGIMDTVLKQPISSFLATSGVLAIILGLAMQNTLADVFSGLAINIERSFGAGDWVTLHEGVEGQIMEIDWRATRIRTFANDMVVIPNSVIAKAIVTNHRKLDAPHLSMLSLKIDSSVSVAHVIKTLEAAANERPAPAAGRASAAYATGFTDSLVTYDLYFAVDHFGLTPAARSRVILRLTDALRDAGISLGGLATQISIIRNDSVAGAPQPVPAAAA
jgi:small-conductance mechanosensitive channel